MSSAKSVVSVNTAKVSDSTAQYHWKFPPKTFPITADGTDFTDFAEIFRFDYIHLYQTASISLVNVDKIILNKNNNNNNNNKFIYFSSYFL